MTSSQYPNSIDVFTTKVDHQDRIYADHPNYLQSAVVNIETELGVGGVKGTQINLKTRLAAAHDNTGNNVDFYTNTSGGDLLIGQVVVFDKSSTTSITLSGGIGNSNIVGVVTEITPNGSETPLISNGLATAKVYAETGDIEIGDWLTTSTVAGFATKATPTTRTYFARATQTLTAGTSAYQIISVGVTNSNVITHGHTSTPGDGGPLGDNVVDGRILDETSDYEMQNLAITQSVIISGNLIVLGKEIVTEVEIISGAQIIVNDLTVYGNSYLGDEASDTTTVEGQLYVADDPNTVDSLGVLNLGKSNDIYNSIVGSSNGVIYSNTPWDFALSQYVNLSDSIIVSGANESFSNLGNITDLLDPTLPQDAATKYYVDSLVAATSGSAGGVPEAPNDGNIYGRQNLAWAVVSGGSSTISGTLGETISGGQPVYQTVVDGKWYKAQAISGKTTLLSVCKVGGNTGDIGQFVKYEKLSSLTGLPSGAELYLSQSNAGEVTSTVPSSGIVAFLGTSNGTTEFNVCIGLVAYDTSTSTSTGSSGSGTGIIWNEVTGTTQSATINNGYIANNAALVTVTLPSTCVLGSIIKVAGKGNGGWKIAQNASQVIHFGVFDSTTGTAGYLQYQHKYDSVELLCITANTDFLVLNSFGNIIIN